MHDPAASNDRHEPASARMTRVAFASVVLAALSACAEAPPASAARQEEVSTVPAEVARADESLASDVPMDPPPAAQDGARSESVDARRAALAAAGKVAAEYSRSFKGHALLVLLDGEIVYEHYETPWTASTRHPLASGTKSFVGVLAAAAVEDGLIAWDQPVSTVIEEWRDDPRKSRITVRQLLELSSGLDPADSTLGSRGGGLIGRAIGADRPSRRGSDPDAARVRDKFAASIEVPMRDEPGTRFRYGPSHFFAFGEMLERVLADARGEGRLEDESLEAYLDRRVLAPIGLGGVSRGWGRDRAGNLNLPGGARLTAREWARFGEFVRRGGRVDGEGGGEVEVIDEEVLLRCFERSAANPGYGLTWWLPRADAAEAAPEADGTLGERLVARGLQRQVSQVPRREVPGRASGGDPDPSLRIWMAAGLGKQRLHVLPDHGLVVVRFGESFAGVQRFDDRQILEPLLQALEVEPLIEPLVEPLVEPAVEPAVESGADEATTEE